MSAEMLRKITIKNCGFDKAAIRALLKDQDSVELLRVVGNTTSATPGQTDLGEFVKLGGTFKAVNIQTGEVFDSSTCILPNFVSEQLAAALQSSPEVDFGLSIGAKVAESVTGYEYTVRPLVEPKVSDKLGALIEAAGINKPIAIEGGKGKQKKAA